MIFLKTCLTLLIFCIAPMLLEAQICPTRDYNPTWDWRKPEYTFYTHNQAGNERIIKHESPWFAKSFITPNVEIFSDQSKKDYEPEDGWVLVQKDFGKERKYINHPYFVLYNKYSGILRIFVAITTVMGENNAAEISLTYASDDERTAILENHSPQKYRNSLLDFDNKVPKIIVPNNYGFSLPYWLHADFIMNYDPCTCNAEQKLTFNVSLISNSFLRFSLNGQAIQQIDNSGIRGRGSRQSLTKTAQGTVDAGTSFFKSATSGIEALKKIFGFDAKDEKYNKWLSQIVPGLGAAAGAVDFLVGAFNNKPAEVKPLVFDINMKAKGQLETSGSYKYIPLKNPGSGNLISSTDLEYNNIMGVFNLLETPVIAYRVKDCEIIDEDYDIEECLYEYKLVNPIKYVINPAIDILDGSLDVRASLWDSSPVPLEQLYRTISFRDDNEAYFFEKDLKKIKLYVTFKTRSGNDVVYVSSYNIRKIYKTSNAFWSNNSGFPSSSPASATDINAVCNSKSYIDKTKEFARVEDRTATKKVNQAVKENLTLYPNPTTDFFTISSNQKGKVNVEVFSLTGSILLSKEMTGGSSLKISTTSFKAGIYLVKTTSDNSTLTKRLIIK